MEPNNIVKTETPQQVLVKRQNTILAFVNIEKMAICCDDLLYSADEELTNLIEIARNKEEPKLQLAAMKILQTRRMDALKHSGLVATATSTSVSPDGTRQTLSTSIVSDALQSVQTFPTNKSKELQDGSEEEITQEETTYDDLSDDGTSGNPNPRDRGPHPIVDEAPTESEHLPGLAGSASI